MKKNTTFIDILHTNSFVVDISDLHSNYIKKEKVITSSWGQKSRRIKNRWLT